ncbi:MAG: TRAM domain-containing protein, partial [Tissierellia bacterium]|nr:TRAM domain-containing protein [Tissierellia bacterium]
RNGKLVHFPGTKDLIGSIIKVKIERVKTFTMEGIVV